MAKYVVNGMAQITLEVEAESMNDALDIFEVTFSGFDFTEMKAYPAEEDDLPW